MGKPIRVLIAGSCEDFRYLLSEIFAGEGDISLVAEAKNAGETVEKAFKLAPEVVVFDPQLPDGDGFDVLKELLERSPHTQVVVVSSLNNNAAFKNAIESGAWDYIAKPCSANALLSSVRQAAAEKARETFECGIGEFPTDVLSDVTGTLRELNVPARMKGATYLKYGLCRAVTDKSALDLITKILYPEIARRYNSLPHRVEKAMRNAIEVSWKSCDRETRAKYFGYAAAEREVKPSNKEFMGAIADYLSVKLQEKYN